MLSARCGAALGTKRSRPRLMCRSRGHHAPVRNNQEHHPERTGPALILPVRRLRADGHDADALRGSPELDLPRSFTIRESSHRIHNPLTGEKLAMLGQALHLAPGTSMLDLACGSGEMLCTW